LSDSIQQKIFIFASFSSKNKSFVPRSGELKRCEICRQLLGGPDTCIYSGHPNEAVEEFIALTNPKLSLFTGDEESFNETDERPQNKLTAFR